VRLPAGLLIAVALALSGCAAPALIATAGFGALQTGTEAFIRGELEAAVANPMAEVFAAGEAAVIELGFKITSSKLGQVNGYIRTRETQARKIVIDVEMKSPMVTKINIRVGVFGDQAISRLILQHIQEKLGPTPVHASGPMP
jgi:hypothetical protein